MGTIHQIIGYYFTITLGMTATIPINKGDSYGKKL